MKPAQLRCGGASLCSLCSLFWPFNPLPLQAKLTGPSPPTTGKVFTRRRVAQLAICSGSFSHQAFFKGSSSAIGSGLAAW